ncbi:ArsR/SmtB family transcription factor [Planctomycetota bacterium]
MTRRTKKKLTPKNNKVTLKAQAELLRVIAHPVRLMILEALSDGPQCVKDLNELVNIVQPMLSQHMATLRRTKLIASHSRGSLRCYYLLRPKLVKNLIRLLQQEHTPQVRDRSFILRELNRRAKVNQKKP